MSRCNDKVVSCPQSGNECTADAVVDAKITADGAAAADADAPQMPSLIPHLQSLLRFVNVGDQSGGTCASFDQIVYFYALVSLSLALLTSLS